MSAIDEIVAKDQRFKAANWIDEQGGLPKYIKRIARHLQEHGMTESHAIAVAVNAAKRMCATGDLNFPGVQQVNPGSRAEACAAVAEWEAMKARAHADRDKGLSVEEARALIVIKAFNPRERRDRRGRWTDTGTSSDMTTALSRLTEPLRSGRSGGRSRGGSGSEASQVHEELLTGGQVYPRDAPTGKPKRGKVAREQLGDYKNTLEKHSTTIKGKRVWSPEREKRHRQIVAEFLKDEDGKLIKPDPSGKKALMSVGGPASGKGSVVEPRRKKRGRGAMVRIDPDAVKERLPEFQAMAEARDPFSGAGVHDESSHVSKMILAEAQARGLNVFVDGVGDSEPGKFKRKVDALKADGYNVTLVGMDLPKQEGQKRAKKRAERTGRVVPPDVVAESYASVPQRHLEWREDPDLEWEMYNNDVPEGQPPILTARKKRRSRKIEIPRPDLYVDQFLNGHTEGATA